MGQARSPFRKFENYIRTVVGLDEKDIQLKIKQSSSNLIIYALLPGICAIKDISEGVYEMGDHERTVQIEHDDLSMKSKPVLTRSGGIYGTLSFNEKSFFENIKCFTPYWDYKPTSAGSPGVNTSDEILNLNARNKKHSICNVINNSISGGLSQPIFFAFNLDKPASCRVFSESETIY